MTAQRLAEHIRSFTGKRWDDPELLKALDSALSLSRSEGMRAEQEAAEQRQNSDWKQRAWEGELTKRLGAFVGLVGEQIPTPGLLRAAAVAPAVESPGWALDVVAALRDADEQAAQEIARKARSTTPHAVARPPGRRSGGVDPVVAFVLGGLFL